MGSRFIHGEKGDKLAAGFDPIERVALPSPETAETSRPHRLPGQRQTVTLKSPRPLPLEPGREAQVHTEGVRVDPLGHHREKRSTGDVLLVLLYLVSFAVIIGLFVSGFDYYMTPYADRPHHAAYRLLRPAGSRGLAFGVIGSAMMVLMLLYTFRKRAHAARRWGAVGRWLDLHIYFGVIGPLFIVLHTSLKVQGLVAVSFWSMVAVALSGFFGRYLYQQIPRNIQGDQLSLKELEAMSGVISQQLRAELGLSDDVAGHIDQLTTLVVSERMSTLHVLATLVKSDLRPALSLHRIRAEFPQLRELPKESLQRVLELTRKQALLQRRVQLLKYVQQIFHYWHVVHKPFAIVMYVVMAIHITVAVWTGYARLY